MNKNENAWGNFRAWIGPFTVACLDTKPLSGSEAQVDLVLIQTLLLLICKSFNCYANQFLISIVSRSTQTSLSYRGLVKYHKTTKWSIDRDKTWAASENTNKNADKTKTKQKFRDKRENI